MKILTMVARAKKKELLKKIISHTPFWPVHIGKYIRKLHFLKHTKAFPLNKLKYVLDAGCGSGEYAKYLALRFPDSEIRAYDVKGGPVWRNAPDNVIFEEKNLLYLDELERYDFCLSIDVLGHIPDNRRVLENIYRALRRGGIFIFICRPGIIGLFFPNICLRISWLRLTPATSEQCTH